MEKAQSEKKRKILDDSAQENMGVANQKKDYRNRLLDAMFDSRIVKYAALLKDESEQNLFCGQVGEVQAVTIANNPEKDCCFLTFIDFDNDEHYITNCVVKKENLLPLFSFDPTRYEQTKVKLNGQLGEDNYTIKKIRDYWDESEVHEISKEKLKNHSRSDTRFEIGQLVTVEFDVKQNLPNNGDFIIQAGQTGIISKKFKNTDFVTDNTDLVEVTFWSMPFGLLALEKKKLFKSPNRFRYSFWEKKIRINKNYLLPLYVENLG
jgi:hypothetical protein